MSFEKRVAVVTGTASGIARAIAVSSPSGGAGRLLIGGDMKTIALVERLAAVSYTAVLSRLMTR